MSLYKLDTSRWYIVRVIFVLAGMLVLASLVLAFVTGSAWWLALAGLVGMMQIIFALTGYCPAAIILDTLGVAR